MMQADPIDRLTRVALISDEEFVASLNELHGYDHRIRLREISEKSGIAQSSLYKIYHGERSSCLQTMHSIIRAMHQLYHVVSEDFIRLIAARPVLKHVVERMVEIDGHRIRAREYPVHTMKDAMVAADRAGREGANAIICAPIVSSAIEQPVHVPVAAIIPRNSVRQTIEPAARKALF
jgi:predicted transcriptional regulator